MYVKVINPKVHGKKEYNNSGSCRAMVNYLSKEDKDRGLEKEFFFSHDRNFVPSEEVVKTIDGMKGQLLQDEAKFYSLVIAPREEAMDLLAGDQHTLMNYTRDVMDIYAQNFNDKNGEHRNLQGKDLVYFAKIEHNRYYKGTDEEVKTGKAKQGDTKPGNNMHVHIIVSRKDKNNKLKLSPLTNSKEMFDRVGFKEKCHQHFDELQKQVGSGKELQLHLMEKDGVKPKQVEYFTKLNEQTVQLAQNKSANPITVKKERDFMDKVIDVLTNIPESSSSRNYAMEAFDRMIEYQGNADLKASEYQTRKPKKKKKKKKRGLGGGFSMGM